MACPRFATTKQKLSIGITAALIAAVSHSATAFQHRTSDAVNGAFQQLLRQPIGPSTTSDGDSASSGKDLDSTYSGNWTHSRRGFLRENVYEMYCISLRNRVFLIIN